MPLLSGKLKYSFFDHDELTVYVEFETSRGTLIKHTIRCGNRSVFNPIYEEIGGKKDILIRVSMGLGTPSIAVVSRI